VETRETKLMKARMASGDMMARTLSIFLQQRAWVKSLFTPCYRIKRGIFGLALEIPAYIGMTAKKSPVSLNEKRVMVF
jgi:hypothetical protein